jgi:hypothetical protein
MKRTTKYLSAIVLCAAMTSFASGNTSKEGKPNQDRSVSSHKLAADASGKSAAHRQNATERKTDANKAKWERDPIVFSTRDRNAIRKYYRGNSAALPPGLAKRNGDLPPGLRRQLRRKGTLPPGLQTRLEPLSIDIERHLPQLRDGYSRGFIGRDVLIVENRTQRIVDVIRDVIIGR